MEKYIREYNAENFDFSNKVFEAVVYVPKNRNYSIMVYPDASMPVSFDWNNFSSNSSYNFSDGLSSYNFSRNTLHKQFNTTMSYVRVYGYIQNITNSTLGWDEFSVVPYLLEPGNMVHTEYGDLPYNLSAFFDSPNSDFYNLTSGFYNISLPTTVESSEMILFATARNSSSFYGGVVNTSFSYSPTPSNIEMNITFYELLGSQSNISMETISGGSINVSFAKQSFNLINGSGASLTNVNAHMEVTVDYSSIGAKEFTWMADISQGGSSVIQVPLINVTGIKEMNVFVAGGNYAPVRKSYTQTQVQSVQNITIGSFNPEKPDGSTFTGLKIALFKSNSSCDVSSPSESCVLGSTDSTAGENFSSFNPMKAIMGGGKLSFRMGLFSSGIIVHYVNVDLLASGPPAALFDDAQNSGTTTGSFESAFRFGSQGPTIYDYVLISMPYIKGSNSTTGLNDSAGVNISIPLFYNESWGVIWNASLDGTNASALAGNYSHYSARQSEWQTLMTGTICHENANSINATNPCYIDKANNRTWIRLPHFSGTGPQITGNVITAAVAEESSSSSSSGSGGFYTPSFWTGTFIPLDGQIEEGYSKELAVKKRIQVVIDGETHYVGVVNLSDTTATINVSSDPQQRIMSVGEEWKVDVSDDNFYDLLVTLNSIKSSKANVTIISINEEVPKAAVISASGNETGTSEGLGIEEGEGVSEKGSLAWLWILFIVLIAIATGYTFYNKRMRKQLYGF